MVKGYFRPQVMNESCPEISKLWKLRDHLGGHVSISLRGHQVLWTGRPGGWSFSTRRQIVLSEKGTHGEVGPLDGQPWEGLCLCGVDNLYLI